MQCTGKFKSISLSYETMKPVITLELNENIDVQEIKEADKLAIEVKKYREKRSLDANAYMWVLLQQMAEVLHTTKDELYVEMLGRYGIFTHTIVKPNVVERIKGEWRVVRELGEVTINGQKGIQLQLYFGSSTYNTKEMSVLLNGIVDEAKSIGVATLDEQEIDRMCKEWQKV